MVSLQKNVVMQYMNEHLEADIYAIAGVVALLVNGFHKPTCMALVHSQEVSRTSHLQPSMQHPIENVQPCLYSLRQSFHELTAIILSGHFGLGLPPRLTRSVVPTK